MLLATSSSGQCINLAEDWKKPDLERIRTLNTFQCPVCNGNVTLKLGTKRIWHFSHQKDALCAGETEPESTYHLLGKKQLYRWLSIQNFTPEMERYFPLLKQRPDLFLPNLSTAFEFQCSTIPTQVFTKRTRSYRKANIDPLWILGAKRLSRSKNSHFYRLDELAFQSLRFSDDCDFSPYLIYFCPLTSSFTLLHSIIPYSSRTVLAATHSIPLKHTHFPFYMNELELPLLKNYYNDWIEKIITTRLYLHVNKDPAVVMMKKHLLNKGVQFNLFPIEAGIPSKHLFWFHSPAYVWQTCFLIEILQPLPIGTSFQFREVFRTFISLIKSYRIKTRSTLPDKNSHISFALMDYLQCLCRFGILKRIDVNHFSKERGLHFPESMTEVRQRMKEYFKI